MIFSIFNVIFIQSSSVEAVMPYSLCTAAPPLKKMEFIIERWIKSRDEIKFCLLEIK